MPGTFGTTTRNLLRYLKGTSLVSDIDEGFQALAEDVDTKMASYLQDTFAKRPAAGQPNRIFKATDTGVLYHDTGTTWEILARGAGALSWGVIAAVGTIEASSGDFTVTKTGTGEYEVKWTVAKSSALYGVTATPITTSLNVGAVVTAVGTASFKVLTSQAGAASNQIFSFTVAAAA